MKGSATAPLTQHPRACFYCIAVMLNVVFPCASAQPPAPGAEKDPAEMRLLKGGTFPIGTDNAELRRFLRERLKEPYIDVFGDDIPPQTRQLPDFYIDTYEVTNQRYAAYVREGGKPSRYRDFPQFNHPLQPVVGITWKDADGFCRWAGKRLPSEVEWERAARGFAGSIWPWGNEPEMARRFNGVHLKLYAATKVGSFPSGNTPEGVADLAGNVWELTSSLRKIDGLHTMKGGSYLNRLSYVRGALRWASKAELKGAPYLGFRCVKDVRR